MNTILFAGDNLPELKELSQSISRAGFSIFICTSDNLWETITKDKPDLIIYSGRLEVVAEMSTAFSRREKIPIITVIKIESFDLIGRNQHIDDFIVKPVNTEELLQRVRKLLWRSSKLEDAEAIKIGDLLINLESYQVHVKNELISLTLKEFELLKFLATHRGKVYTREFLLNQIWGYDYYGGMRTVDVHVRRLRSKLELGEEIYIETVRGVGYRFK